MKGPESAENLALGEGQPEELLWLRGARSEMVSGDGKQPVSQEFNCHTELDFGNYDGSSHQKAFGQNKNIIQWIFAMSEGQTTIKFPDGFGLPILSNETLTLSSQVLNNTVENANFQVRYKYRLDFVRNRDLKESLKPLFVRMAPAVVPFETSPSLSGTGQKTPAKEDGGTCLLHKRASDRSQYEDPSGVKYTPHWVVNPGREVIHSSVTRFLDLPFDTSVHYIAVHLHPYAESVELRDVTANKSIFKSEAVNHKDRMGLESVGYFSSVEGAPMFKDHEYELVTTYNNTTDVPHDAMAAMWLYLFDKEFKVPVLKKVVNN